MLAAVVLILLTALSAVTGQDPECPEVQASDLGNTTSPTGEGLIAAITLVGDASGSPPPDVQLLNFTIVCLAVGTERNRYRLASVVTEYSCSGAVPVTSPIACDDSGTTVYRVQFDLQCTDGSDGPEWERSTVAAIVSGDSVFEPPSASLDSALSKQCSLCVDPDVLGGTDTTTHCTGNQCAQM